MAAQPHHWLEVEEVGNVTLVRLIPPRLLDERETRVVGQQLYNLVDSGKTRLAIDFANVTTLTSALTGKLINLQKRVEAAEGRLVLCHLPQMLDEMFYRTGLKKLFHVYPTVAEGLASF